MSELGVPVRSMLSVVGPAGRLTIGETDEATLRDYSAAGLLHCPHCGKGVRYRRGPIRRAHFSHKADPCEDRYGEPDGPEHRAMKWAMLAWLRRQSSVASVEPEVTIETRQRADVLATLVDGKRLAVEVQRSSLSGMGWMERHDLYVSVGVQDLWLLHPQRVHLVPTRDSAHPTMPRLTVLGGAVVRFQFDDLTLTLYRHGVPLVLLDAEGERPATTFLADPQPLGRDLVVVALRVPLDDPGLRLEDGQLAWRPLVRVLAEPDPPRTQERLPLAGDDTPTPQHLSTPRRIVMQTRALALAQAALMEQERAAEERMARWRAAMRQHPAWQDLARRGLVDPDPDRLHPLFGVPLPYGSLINVDPRLWQAVLYYEHHAALRWISVAAVAAMLRPLNAATHHRLQRETLCRRWLAYLEALDVAKYEQARGGWIVPTRPQPDKDIPQLAAVIPAWREAAEETRLGLARLVCRERRGVDPEELVATMPPVVVPLFA